MGAAKADQELKCASSGRCRWVLYPGEIELPAFGTPVWILTSTVLYLDKSNRPELGGTQVCPSSNAFSPLYSRRT
jgi:hypothetical protein